MNLFQAVKEAVTAKEAAVFYGIEVKRNNMACCPFHNDRTPSMKIDRRYHCFGCGEDGDVINFTAKLFGLGQYEAAMKLVNDMGLVVPEECLARERTKAEKARDALAANRARTERAREKQFEAAVRRIYLAYCDYLQLLERWAEYYIPRGPDEEPHPLFLEAVWKRDQVEHLLDVLSYGTVEEKAQAVADKAKEVEEVERRVKKCKSGNREFPAHGPGGGPAGHGRGECAGTVGTDGKRAGKKYCKERGNDPVL